MAAKVEVGKHVECPKCGHKFWHKIGSAFKGAIKKAAAAGIDIVSVVASGGEPGVPR